MQITDDRVPVCLRTRVWRQPATALPRCICAACRQLGVDETHNYRDASLLAKLYGKGGRQFDAVFEAVGGEGCWRQLCHGMALA